MHVRTPQPGFALMSKMLIQEIMQSVDHNNYWAHILVHL